MSGARFKGQDQYLDEMTNIAQRLKFQIKDINHEVVDQNTNLSEIELELQKT
jgi:hypothetical protein